jgi:integrase
MSSIQKRPNGKWRARYRDVGGREHARHFARKVDAQRWLDEVTADVMTGRYVDPRAGDMTFSAYMEAWSELQVWKPRTAVGMNLIRRSVTFGDVPLRQLTPTHVESWKKSMVAAGYAVLTVNHRLTAVRSVLKAAVDENRIAVNPAARVKLVRQEGRTKRVEIPSVSAVAAVLGATEARMRAYVRLAAFAGLRLGECGRPG